MSLFNAATLLCALINDKIGLVVGRAIQGKLLTQNLLFYRSANIEILKAWGLHLRFRLRRA